jgi:hypothetical protein
MADDKNEFYNVIPEESGKVGLAFCGGGTKASAITLGFLKFLNSKNELDNKKIQYISSNSGSTWITLPLLYETQEQMSDMLDNNVLISRTSSFDSYNTSYKNSFFKKLISNTLDISNSWNNFVSKNFFVERYSPELKLKMNVPIPIAVATYFYQNSTELKFLPVDFTPISSGFLSFEDVKKFGISNYLRVKSNKYSLNTTWNPSLMSSCSSSVLSLPLYNYALKFPAVQNLISNIIPRVQVNGTSNTSYIGDGYLVDDTSVISLLARNVKHIFSMIYPERRYMRISANWYTNIGDYVFVIIDKNTLVGKVINKIYINNQDYEFEIQFFVSENVFFTNKFKSPSSNMVFSLSLPLLNSVCSHLEYVIDKDNNKVNKNVQYVTEQTMMENYLKTGIMYSDLTYQTNTKLNKSPYKVRILFYCLSWCQPFYMELSQQNRERIDYIRNFPNLCTINPIYDDTINPNNSSSDYTCECKDISEDLFPIINNGIKKSLQQLTKTQAVSLACFGQYIAEKLYFVFKNNDSPYTYSFPSTYPFKIKQKASEYIIPSYLRSVLNFNFGDIRQMVIIVTLPDVKIDYNPQMSTSVTRNTSYYKTVNRIVPLIFGAGATFLTYSGLSDLNCYFTISSVTDKNIKPVFCQILVSFPNIFTDERTVTFRKPTSYTNFVQFNGGKGGKPPALFIFGL